MSWTHVMIAFAGDSEAKKEDVAMWSDRCK